MLFQKISITLLLLNVSVISLPLYKNKKVFEIVSDNKNYDEQNENEMIQPADLATMGFYIEDESRYKPLHSLVENYNKRETVNKVQLANMFTQLEPIIWENSNTIERNNEPFIAGFKEDLDKVLWKIENRNFHEEMFRTKRENEQHLYQTPPEENKDFFQMKPMDSSLWETTTNIPNADEYEQELTFKLRKHTTVNMKVYTVDIEKTEPDEEVYDYEKFKREYEEQIAQGTTDKKQSEKYPEESLQKLLDFKNCTEASTKFGIKAIDCSIYNYEHEKPVVKKILQKIWLIVRIWFLIYVCLAVLCWCQKGWCCCCFRCKICFPRKTILFAKQYCANNPPGMLAEEVRRKGETQQFVTYEPTEFEEDAFEQFESAIRNI